MKFIAMLAALTFSVTATEIAWNPNPEPNIIGYNVWLEDNGNYYLLGTTKSANFDLGVVAIPKRVCVSAMAAGGIDGAKSEVMVIHPNEPAPYTYVSIHGNQTYTFAVNASAASRFFRFNVVGNQATLQASYTLNSWADLVSVFVAGGGFENPQVTLSTR